jgi:hypothetical protein
MLHTTAGQIINIMSNDVARIDAALFVMNYIWMSPAQLLICCYFMYARMGPSVMVGISAFLLAIPLQCKCVHGVYEKKSVNILFSK